MLTELLVAIGISGIIAVAASVAVFQVLSGNAQDTTHMKALKQVENAVYHIGRDAQMAQTVQTGGESGLPLNLSWVNWDNTMVQVTYAVQNSELRRDYSVNGGQPISTVVARNINTESEATNFQFADDVLAFKITASLEGFRPASETRVCQIIPRPQ